MNAPIIKIIVASALLVISLVFGYLLSNAGKPYSVVLMSIHKLSSLLAGIALVVIVWQFQKAAQLSALQWAVIAVTGILFLATFVTGAVLTVQKETNSIVLTVHKIGPVLTTLSSAAAFYLLAK